MTLFPIVKSKDSPWCDLAIETYKMLPLNPPNQALRRSEDLGDNVYRTFKQFA